MFRCVRVFLLLCALGLIFPLGSAYAGAEAPRVLKTAWLGEHEAFPAWYSKKAGLDRDAGLSLTMLRFATGADLVGEERAFDWLVGACGALPAVAGKQSGEMEIIGIANDESRANAVLARPDNPVFATAGPAGFPDIFGSAESVRGKTILCPRATSAHYLLDRWLTALGLTEKDVNIRFMAPRKALGAFRSGYGDFVVLWSPELRQALREGLKVVARSDQCGAPQLTLLVARAGAAEASPGAVSAFLRLYLDAAEKLAALPEDEAAALYQEFCREWAGVELSREEAVAELRDHPMFTRARQLEMFGPVPAEGPLARHLGDMGAFAGEKGAGSAGSTPARLNDAYLRAAH